MNMMLRVMSKRLKSGDLYICVTRRYPHSKKSLVLYRRCLIQNMEGYSYGKILYAKGLLLVRHCPARISGEKCR